MDSYEKKHKEEITRATQLWECGDITRENLEYIFPELKESEDEKIRKWIISTLKSLNMTAVQIDGAYEMMLPAIVWLEKQGEKKPTDSYCQEHCKGYQETGKCFADWDCKEKRETDETK